MSELTPCNLCSLRDSAKRAAKDGATVSVKAAGEDMPGWLAVWRSDHDRPIGWFMELPGVCAC